MFIKEKREGGAVRKKKASRGDRSREEEQKFVKEKERKRVFLSEKREVLFFWEREVPRVLFLFV